MTAILPLLVAAVGGLVCLSWCVDPGMASMKFTTGLMFVLSGAMLHAMRITNPKRSDWQRYIAVVSIYGLLAMLIGLVFPAMLADPGVEVFFPHDMKASLLIDDGRASAGTYFLFTLVAIAALVAMVHEQNAVLTRTILGTVIMTYAGTAILGTMSGPVLYWREAMALPTACLFFCLGVTLILTPLKGFSWWVLRPRTCKPGPMTIVLIGEEMSQLQFVVQLPPAGAADVIERRFTLESPLGKTDITLPGDATLVEGLEAPEATALTLTLVDVDDAGNKSEPRVQTVTLVDNLAPPQPGEMGVQVTAEGGVSEEAPAEEPSSDDTPTDELPVDTTPVDTMAADAIGAEAERPASAI